MNLNKRAATLALAGAAAAATLASAQQDSTVREIERYRAALSEDNPADLWIERGAALWKEKRGPKNASLEKCDIGLGPGVVKGAYTVLPKYFADTDKVQDLESRLVTCMVTLQGLTPAEATKDHFGDGPKRSAMEALVGYIASESRGMKMNVAATHPKEREALAIGEKMFFYRAGPHDFSCATCHSHDSLRIRLQDLPNLTKTADAQRAYTTWPGYRVSQGELRTMQHRLFDCYRQQRFPEPGYASDAVTALTLYLAHNANGGVYNAPAMKR
ncbi:MAG: sulfur oxidation c-type cytochrome SoxA [Bacillota bacterium]